MLVAAGPSELHTTRTADITHRRKSAEWDGLLSFFYTVNSNLWCLRMDQHGNTQSFVFYLVVFVVLYYIITLYSRNKEVGKECTVMSLCNNFSKNDKTVYNEFTILPEA
jgi:hypothetical protein